MFNGEQLRRFFVTLKGLEILSSAIKMGTWRLRRYCNADWTSDRDERKSTIRYAFLLNDTTITWRSKKQSYIALSTMES